MRLSTTLVDCLFQKLGVEFKECGFTYGWVIIDGKRTLPVQYRTDRNGEMGDETFLRLLELLYLTEDQFSDFSECTRPGSDYRDLLKDRDLLR